MPNHRYYTLVTSLPHLPWFEWAERLPINRLRLDQRLTMLAPDDAAQLTRAWALAFWSRDIKTSADLDFDKRFRLVYQQTSNLVLRNFLEFRAELRTIMAALRRRHRGEDAPPGEKWGVGSRVRWLEQHWSEPDFGLSGIHRWLPEVRAALEAGNSIEVERLLIGATWRCLDRLAAPHPFGFEAVIRFVFQWDMLSKWTCYDADGGKRQFQALMKEVTRGHDLFAE